ncbi:Nucleotide-binding universal stress protein, UspA family [bacterium A37T11]|nr:Nucleotide-binding universal stress protein, UspA family [bacterium A37T11]
METSAKIFGRILIAVEDSSYSELALQYGFDLASKTGATVALVHVIDPPSAATYGSNPLVGQDDSIILPEIADIQEENSKALLERLSRQWNQEGGLYTFQKIGHPSTEILLTAEEWGADLIVLGTHGRTGFDHFISGSVAEGVARRSIFPVLIVPNKTA